MQTDGSDNVIAVRVDSQKHYDIPPEGGSADYCLFGGIVRNVTLLAVNPAYIANAFISTPSLSDGCGIVRSQINVQNSSDKLIAAAYSSSGELIQSRVFDIDSSGRVDPGDFPANAYVRLFVWNGVDEMLPLSEAWEVNQ